MIFIEWLILLSTILPIFHLINALTERKRKVYRVKEKKRFSILVPCYNEEDTVLLSIRGLLGMDYRNFEAIYINDGSDDNTLNVLDNALELIPLPGFVAGVIGVKALYRSKKHPNFFVIDKHNGGKSTALNAGLRFARSELVVTLDADSVLHREALCHMNRVFEDNDVVAAGGSIHIMQGYDAHYLNKHTGIKRKALIILQILEYLKGFYIYKMSLSRQHAMAIISGAFGVFRRDILLKAGGYRNTLGEDIDITMRIQQLIHKTTQKILYIPEALCYTQCPENLSDLKKQRLRWQKGFIDCVAHYKWFLLKTFLTRSLSFHFLVEAMVVGICSCLFTIFTYVFVAVLASGDFQTVRIFSMYFGFCIVFNIVYSLSALAISVRYNRYPKGIMKKAWLAIPLDLLFYRYFNLLIYICGTVLYFWTSKRKFNWNKVQRVKSEICISNVVSEI